MHNLLRTFRYITPYSQLFSSSILIRQKIPALSPGQAGFMPHILMET
jgi:hypothetical protein